MRRMWVIWQDNDEPVRQPVRICCSTASTSPVDQNWGQLYDISQVQLEL